ncbi:uncharacterized protein K02A2.6-like [Leguminivora glycinivorella]|uniref:uncharacterized protein K02A2.6-like n=1 Tax=Leguminivora glycinivorella TaxID=1035111 RepID=UPI00200FDD41|nr:uncharacterized protein K02A2.6-like [Leguminivora glycinivorella]
MTIPEDKKGLERFIGMTNYVSRFIHNYADKVEPLRELLKKDVSFEWHEAHTRAFDDLKRQLAQAPTLRYYSPNEPVTVSVDASSRGLGAVLLQAGRPVAYAARTLTPTESRWAQIEKELLAILFGCRRLMYVADTLSRATRDLGGKCDQRIQEQVSLHINTLVTNLPFSSNKMQAIREATRIDQSLCEVMDLYRKGWPHTKSQVTEKAKSYWEVRDEIHVVEDVVFRNDLVIIPNSLRAEMINKVHEGHLGIEKCKRRARDVMWWPGMAAAVERAVRECEACAQRRAAPPREPLAPHAVPDRPWQVLATDIFQVKDKHYLLVVDYYSKYVEVATLVDLRSATVIGILKPMFARHGIPQRLVSDNGCQFVSQEFRDFAKDWDFEQVTSSPHYPRSNGFSERNVQTVKNMIIKSQETKTDFYVALLNFRNTPISGEKYSPAQLLFGRRLNTKLPVKSCLLNPKTPLKKK